MARLTLYPSRLSCCPADTTRESAVVERVVGPPMARRRVRAKQIHHTLGPARFWHWSDQIGRLDHSSLPLRDLLHQEDDEQDEDDDDEELSKVVPVHAEVIPAERRRYTDEVE